MLGDAVLVGRPAHVLEDRRTVGDRLRLTPRRERVAERVHVGVRANPRIAEQVPGAADRVTRLQQREAAIRCITPQVTRGADPRQTSADDQDINMFSVGTHAYQAKRSCRARRYDQPPVQYPVESFTDAERQLLAPHCSNLDGPVFALTNLPETVKGALFARYSRHPGTLRRLMLDEFAGDLQDPVGSSPAGSEGAGRATQLYERIFLGYGDDSVAQLGGAHVACEWVSNLLTKILQRPRLAAYLEQSTRYIAYDVPMPADRPGDRPRYRYYTDPELGPEYELAMDELFSIYSASIPVVTAWAAQEFPIADGDSPAAHERAIRAKALDLLRGLLPAASLSHMGIYASGQTYEQLIMHLLAHPLPEARTYGELLLTEVQAVIPSFVARVPRPERGGEWIEYLRERGRAGDRWARRSISGPTGRTRRPARRSRSPTSTGPRRICSARCCSSRPGRLSSRPGRRCGR